MSDQQIGTKEEEGIALGYFLEAYEFATGVHLHLPLLSHSERPDFVCQAPTGELVGVEITKVMMPPLIPLSDSTQLYDYKSLSVNRNYLSVSDQRAC